MCAGKARMFLRHVLGSSKGLHYSRQQIHVPMLRFNQWIYDIRHLHGQFQMQRAVVGWYAAHAPHAADADAKALDAHAPARSVRIWRIRRHRDFDVYIKRGVEYVSGRKFRKQLSADKQLDRFHAIQFQHIFNDDTGNS